MTLTPTTPHPQLRRMPVPDGLSSAGPPLELAWLSREAHHLGDGQFRLSVPCVLEVAVADGVHTDLTTELRRRWVERPRRTSGWRITAVVAAFNAGSERSAELTLAITTAGDALPDAIDDALMHAELGRALERVFAPEPHRSTL